MPKLLVVFIVLAALAVLWLQPGGGDAGKVSYEAKAAFLKKCIRDMGRAGACEAPEQARLPLAP